MKIELGEIELAAIKIAEQAVRVLPEQPCLYPFPFLCLLDFESREENTEEDEEDITTVTFRAQMSRGCFSSLHQDRSCWPEFVLHMVENDSGSLGCNSAQVRYESLKDQFHQIGSLLPSTKMVRSTKFASKSKHLLLKHQPFLRDTHESLATFQKRTPVFIYPTTVTLTGLSSKTAGLLGCYQFLFQYPVFLASGAR